MRDFLVLTVNRFEQDGLLDQGPVREWRLQFRGSNGGTLVTAHFDIDWLADDRRRLRLRLEDNGRFESTRIDLQRSPNGSWWFICPLQSEGRPCGRRVAKLYRPPISVGFGCRFCYGLQYARLPKSRDGDDG